MPLLIDMPEGQYARDVLQAGVAADPEAVDQSQLLQPRVAGKVQQARLRDPGDAACQKRGVSKMR
jgi:hypothetical protein